MARSSLPVLLASIALVASPGLAAAATIGARVEVGIGSTTVRPLESQSAPGPTVSAGLSFPLSARSHCALEITASNGVDFGARIPEASSPGDRSLTTFLIGIELHSAGQRAGGFTFMGAGVGRGTLSGALGVFAPPYDRWLEPSRAVTAFAAGAGAGYRFAGGPGPLGLSLAIRTHMVVHAGQIAWSATAVTMGLAY